MPEKHITPSSETGAAQSDDAKRARRTDRPTLPMDEHRQEVVECVRGNASAVIIGETGSGKTTRIPVFLLEAFPKAKVAITQPRRVAARSVARYVAGQRGERIGGEVGYQVRFEDRTTEGTRANFMTDGILLRKLQSDPLLEEYDVVMVDEAHERSLNIDFILGLLKRVQAERAKIGKKPLKVIVTSATIEKEKFAAYFNESPVVEVPGRMFPVEVKYESEPIRDHIKKAAEKVQEIVASNAPGDILIFMPGEEDIRQTIQEIQRLNVSGIDPMPLFGAMAPEDQDRIFEKNPKRKVIVSTNIAETSVTIDGVRFVIDSGLIKQKEFNPSTGIEALLTKYHAKSGCEQRKGRAGRTAPGVCYRLYTEDEYNNRNAYQTPEIARSNLDHVILAMKKIGIDDARGFDFIDRPKEEAISRAIETLKMLGALDANEKLTKIGETMAELPLRPEIARMVLEGKKHHCVGKVCTIAAMLGEKSVFTRPKEKESEADKAHAQFAKGGSDFLKLLEVWNQWSASGFNETWAREHFLNVRQLFEVREIRSQLMRELKHQNIPVDDANGNDPIAIQKCIAAGLIQHLMISSGHHAYGRVVRDSSASYTGAIFIHPSSAAFSVAPQLMIGADVFTTSKTFARRCQPVNPEWLLEIAPQLLEEGAKSLRYDEETDSVIENVSYSFRGRYGVICAQERAVTDDKVAAEQFARALAERKVDLPCVRHNQEAKETLRALRIRSGGMIEEPVLAVWYKEQAGGAASKREATYIDEALRIHVETFCPPEMRADIDRLYPETINIRGAIVKIAYDYRPANPNGWSESEKKELFTATLIIPPDLAFLISGEEIPTIGQNGRPAIKYHSGEDYSAITADTFEKFKEKLDAKRIEQEWYNFKAPETPNIAVSLLEPLPTFESLGVGPIVYAKNYRGEDVYAMPGIVVKEQYNPVQGGYVFQYSVQYFRTSEEADSSTKRAIEKKTQSDASEQRRLDREQFLAPAKEQHEALKDVMSDLSSRYEETGFSYNEYSDIRRQYDEARYALESSDADPKKALEILETIRKALTAKQEDKERRLGRVDEVKRKMDALAPKIKKITYDTYLRFGLSYDQCSALQRKWSEAVSALKIQDRRGQPVLPDPDKAESLLTELAAELPEEQSFTPEQEELAEVLSGRDASYAKIIRVRGGQVTESFSPKNPSDVSHAPEEISIGGSGRALLAHGSRLTFIYGGGSKGDTWRLDDGDYLFDRDARTVLRVEEKPGSPYGWRALARVGSSYDEPRADREPKSRPYYESAQTAALPGEKFGVNVFAQLLGNIGKGAPTREPTAPKPEAEARSKPKMPVEREKMTEEIRALLLAELANARLFLDNAIVIPEPDKKDPNAGKATKLKAKIKDARRELRDFETELAVMDDATRARGKVAELIRRAESAAKESARLMNKREDWPSVFQQYAARIREIAVAQEAELDDSALKKIYPKLIALAQQKRDPEDLDSELETILIDSI